MTQRYPTLVLALAAAALSACAGSTRAPELPSPDEGGVPGARGVPGFDTRDYPGDGVMAAWRESSPYRWVGYYLPAPCYTGTSWQGKREALEGMGWGIAVLFVGEQDWSEGVSEPGDAGPAALCTRQNVTAERGAADADAAVAAAAAEGFGAGTVVYLDVERVDAVSERLEAYVRAWFDGVLGHGRYAPGLYAHSANAPALLPVAEAAFREAGRSDGPRLWVVDTDGFNLRRAPAESGFSRAAIWQGVLDARETWGGHTLRIDANVAASADPSG